MTVKQYSNFTLDLNEIVDIKVNKIKEWYITYGGGYDFELVDSYQVFLKDKSFYLVEEGNQLYNDYQEFTKTKVIQEAFESVFNSVVDPVKVANQVLKFRKLNTEWTTRRNLFGECLILDNHKEETISFYPLCNNLRVWNVTTNTYYVKENFNIKYPTTNSEWIKVIEFVLDEYYKLQKVDPVNIAKELLKTKNSKLWVVVNTDKKVHFSLVEYPNIWINFKNEDLMFSTVDINNNYLLRVENNRLTTKQDWINLINSALDKYYELQEQPNEVELKLMLGKALKDNGLVAKEVFTTPECIAKIIADFGHNQLKWVAYPDKKVSVYLVKNINSEGTLACYKFNNAKDWQTIFFDSLAQYKKLTDKITPENIIKCCEDTIKLPVSGLSNKDSLCSLKVTYKGIIIEWVIKDDTVEVSWLCKASILTEEYDKPTTLEEWSKLFKKSSNKIIQKIEINNCVVNGYKQEPTLIDLIKKAFPSYNLTLDSKVSNYEFYKGRKSIYNLTVEITNNNVTAFIVLDPQKECLFHLIHPFKIINTENLTNYTEWEQWLEDLVKLKQNLKELEQSPVKIIKAVKNSQRNVSTPTTQQEIEDFWAD